jgi:hypothetical protein
MELSLRVEVVVEEGVQGKITGTSFVRIRLDVRGMTLKKVHGVKMVHVKAVPTLFLVVNTNAT